MSLISFSIHLIIWSVTYCLVFASIAFANTLSNDLNSTNALVLPLKTPVEFDVPTSHSIYIRDRILKARTQNSKIYLVGQKPGSTLLKVADKVYKVQVLDHDNWRAHTHFDSFFKHHPNLKIDYEDSKTFVRGEILLTEDFIHLLEWLETYKIKPLFHLKIENPDLKAEALNILTRQLGIPIINFDDSMTLQPLRQLTPEETKLVNSYGFNFNHEIKNGNRLGTLDVQFINVSDSELKNALPLLPTSFQWTVDQKIKILSQVIDSDFSKTTTLNKKSSTIHLMLFENEKTEYHSGGEFAIQQKSLYRNDLQWKSFGLFLEVNPVSLSTDEVLLQMKFKISYLISSDLSQPSLSQDSWTQTLKIQKNKSLVVSNSFTNMFTKDKKNHLLFGSIPILKNLFRGSNSNKENSNVYMVIKLNKDLE